MRRLSFIILVLMVAANLFAQSPHGKNFKIDCSVCHNTDGWKVKVKEISFDHDKTNFQLTGQHKSVECRMCHSILIFSEAKNDCISCHKDFHQNSVSKDCSKCHSPQSWLVQNVNEVHRMSRFPLIGSHQNQDCQLCHANYATLNFTVNGVQCYDCHRKDYEATKYPNHVTGNFSKDCQVCHLSSSIKWSSSNTTHEFFPLTGGHAIENCFSCHKVATFSGLSKECYSCHSSNFSQTVNPSHIAANFSTNCIQCHTITKWKNSSFNHSATNFVLTGRHANQSCNSCHSSGYKGTSSVCYSCHKSNFESSRNPNHVTSNFPTTCEQCHSTNGWTSTTFNHALTKFPLVGKHTTATCTACHSTGYVNTSTLCYSCHKSNFDATKSPNHLTSDIPTTCEQCHSTSEWTPATFNHALTKFPLTGKHITVSCSSCHKSGYTNTTTDCYSCHQTNYAQTKNPSHTAAYFPTTCSDCHTTGGWTPATFDHDGRFFPVYSGKHKATWNNCNECHNVPTSFKSFSCTNCHEHNQVEMDKNHSGINGYAYQSISCFNCHPTGSKTGSFNHSTTRFPLTGSHTKVVCQQCHLNSYANTSMECVSCHQSSFDSSKNPNHRLIGIGTDCAKCHTPTIWTSSTFSHSATAFILIGKHETTTCESCHKGKTTGTNQLCAGCHQASFNSSKIPNHVAVGISTDCQMCHSATGWVPSSFSHSTTSFILTGKHIASTCESCHKGKTTGTTQLCYGCHKINFDGSKNPNHVTSNFPTTCEQCHSTSGWTPTTFNHATTKFPLVGKHTTATCSACHSSGYTNTSTLCYSCHKANFDASKNPNHVTSNFPTACEQCHSTSGWTPATFNHATTKFPLVGKHTTATCAACHSAGYTNTSTLCYSCHKANFDASKNPNHVASNFPTTCEQCHSTNGWTPATFNHATTKFPLTGKHVTVACASCHKSGYTNTPLDCYSCHQTVYTQTKTPSHTASSFPTTCADCHTTNGWTPATFDHDGKYFPIYSGNHKGEWNSCADCHNVASNYKAFACTNCHEHTLTNTNNDHRGVQNYVYQSSACYTCHPKGRK